MIPFIKLSSQIPQLFNSLGNLHSLMSLNTQAYTRLGRAYDRVYNQVFDLTYTTGITLLKRNFVVLNLFHSVCFSELCSSFSFSLIFSFLSFCLHSTSLLTVSRFKHTSVDRKLRVCLHRQSRELRQICWEDSERKNILLIPDTGTFYELSFSKLIQTDKF